MTARAGSSAAPAAGMSAGPSVGDREVVLPGSTVMWLHRILHLCDHVPDHKTWHPPGNHLLAPSILATSGEIRPGPRYLKIRQLSQGNGHPENVPAHGTHAYRQP